MKLMKRIKDILFDEEEVEIPVIEEKTSSNKPVNIESTDDSIKEIKMPEEDFSDKENFKSELTFPFPIEFDEDELAKTKPIETVRKQVEPERTRERDYNSYSRYEIKREEPRKAEREIKDYSSYLRTKEEKKQFKPTPIISPVYGVLDQNYKKEDVVLKDDIKREPISTSNGRLDLDEIRKKAYGESNDVEIEIDNTKELEIIEDVELDPNKTIGELYEESINLTDSDNTIEEPRKIVDIIEDVEENPTVELSDLIAEKDNVEKKLASTITDEDDETDLFSLIDSMYEENNE